MRCPNFFGNGLAKCCFNDSVETFRVPLLVCNFTPHSSEIELIAAVVPGKLNNTGNPDKLKCFEYLRLIRVSSGSGVSAQPTTPPRW